jgi:Rieske Fe-S protein
VVTQPTKGEFKGFSAVCTHQGCTVNEVAGGTINCPCHGSKFDVTDGSVTAGPAPKPLEYKSVKVEGGQIRLG